MCLVITKNVREKFYALRAFIYKARRASKKVAGKYVLKKTFLAQFKVIK
jgi:hypothetical protein